MLSTWTYSHVGVPPEVAVAGFFSLLIPNEHGVSKAQQEYHYNWGWFHQVPLGNFDLIESQTHHKIPLQIQHVNSEWKFGLGYRFSQDYLITGLGYLWGTKRNYFYQELGLRFCRDNDTGPADNQENNVAPCINLIFSNESASSEQRHFTQSIKLSLSFI
jgi:hypothetical protein